LSVDGMLVHRRDTTSIKLADTHLYTWVERGPVRVTCLGQEHNTMSPAGTRTKSARSGVERINHETTVPLAGQSLYPKPRNLYLHMLYYSAVAGLNILGGHSTSAEGASF